jgi:hypothetical protein
MEEALEFHAKIFCRKSRSIDCDSNEAALRRVSEGGGRREEGGGRREERGREFHITKYHRTKKYKY